MSQAPNLPVVVGTNKENTGPLQTECEVVIPFNTTTIEENAFTDCIHIKSVKIPYTVTEIKYAAFAGCSGLSSIYIPSSVVRIGASVFKFCTNLETIHLPDGIEYIASMLFQGCRKLQTFVIPESVSIIQNNAFQDSGLTSITIGPNVRKIRDWAFFRCNHLEMVTIRTEDVFQLEQGTFQRCEKLESINLPPTLSEIGEQCFNSSGLKSIHIPDSVEIIGEESFSKCKNLQFVTGGQNVKNIGEYAFAECFSLSGFQISESLITLREGTFMKCYQLKEIQIPGNVETIDKYAFHKCSRLTSIDVPDNVNNIHNYAFWECKNLRKVILNPNTTNVSWNAFYDCPKLTLVICRADNLEDGDEPVFGLASEEAKILVGTDFNQARLYNNSDRTLALEAPRAVTQRIGKQIFKFKFFNPQNFQLYSKTQKEKARLIVRILTLSRESKLPALPQLPQEIAIIILGFNEVEGPIRLESTIKISTYVG